MKRQVNFVEDFIFVRAKILWLLANKPTRLPDEETIESIRLDGWLKKHPARLTVSAHTNPIVHGHHRLALLMSDGHADSKVPCILRMLNYTKKISPLSEWVEKL